MKRIARILMVAPLILLSASCSRPPTARMNLLVVTLDTTRADRLGCYGREGARTQTLDRLAATGTLFELCRTAVPITTPSHATIFTGTYPSSHGVRDNGLFHLPDEAVTLAEVLKKHGYTTGAAVGAFPLTRDWGLDQGFDFYDDHVTVDQEDERGVRLQGRRMYYDERPAARVNEAILPWLRENADRPIFIWVHYWDPHLPYTAPAPFSDVFAHDPYQAEIAYVDQVLGRLLDELDELGVADRTVVAVVGDHGEGLGEHGEDTHSMLLYDSTLHVPLIVRAPGWPAGVRVREPVGTVDLMPTLLELLGLDSPAEVAGRSLTAAMGGGRRRGAEPPAYYAETLSPRLSYGWGELRALMTGGLKYVHGPRQELFVVDVDPDELVNLAPSPDSERLEAELATFVERHSRPTARRAVKEVDSDTLDRLAALGYLSGDGEAPTVIDETLTTAGDPPQDHIRNVNRWSACKQALENQDHLAARDLAAELVRSEPANAFYRALMVTALTGLGQLEQAAEVAEQGPVTAQNDGAYLQLAHLLYSAGGWQRAEELVRRVLEQRPSADAQFTLAEMRGLDGDVAGRESGLRAALELDPRHLRARRSLAVALADAGRSQEAEIELRTVLAQAPLDPSSHLNLATLLLKEGRYREAEESLARALTLDPGYCRAHLATVAMRVASDDPAGADEALAVLEGGCRDPRVQAEARALVRTR